MIDRYQSLTVEIARISRYIKRIKTEEIAEIDPSLKGPHISCLYYIYKNNGTMTAKEISDICDEDKASISRSIDYLEHNGYLTCECKTEKRYKSPIFLTDKGTKISQQIKEKIDNIVELAGIGLTEENRINFYRTLFLISNNLKNIYDNYGEN